MKKRYDSSAFDIVNQEKPSWDKRYSLIREIYPTVENLDWARVFREDPDIMGDIINEISKAADASPGRPGKRPPVSRSVARDNFAKLSGQDYSLEAFHPTLDILMQGHTIRQISETSGLERNHLYRIIKGKDPDIYSIEQLAKAFKKRPEFFLEYRIFFVMTFLTNRLESIPEASITFFRKIAKIGKLT